MILDSEPKLLDRRELAARLGVGQTTLSKLLHSGLPCIRIPMTKCIRFDLPEVLEWMKTSPRNKRN